MADKFYAVVISEDGRFSGRILKEVDLSWVYWRGDLDLRERLKKKMEFCLFEKSALSSVEDGQIWECELVREFVDKRGKKVKILKPVKLVHNHVASANDEANFRYKVVSGFWMKYVPLEVEVNPVEFKDEFIHYVVKDIKAVFRCPICGEVKEMIRKVKEVLYEAPIDEIMKYWEDYLGSEFWEVVERKWKLEKDIDSMKREFERREEEIRSCISELEFVGRERRKLTEEEKRGYADSVWDYWMKAGGDPFDEPSEPPECIWTIVDLDAVEKAKKEIELLKVSLKEEERRLEEKVEQMYEEFENDEVVKRVKKKAIELISKRLYPAVIREINKYDPYFFEFTSLELMDPFDAVKYVFRAYKSNRKREMSEKI